ncbi:hypothetical protein IFM89_011705 [Coptis chinensis]|uniref:Peptidase S54 rhomboid domain-containing protein n=1 Tax=Coptis chinensis TaxID=261450 RepID=A0A835IVY0_9MAGN|nr:hypothetical protein IFM89_011705 [Coptis chinensis]
MQKLYLPYKLLSQIPVKHICKSIVVGSITQTTLKHSFNSWRSYHGFLANAHLRNQSKKFIDHVLFMRSQLQRRGYQVHRYNTPRYNWRSSIPTADNVVLGLISANVAVFMLWRYLDTSFMRKHFMISVENVRNGRVHTMITSAFSHIDVGHLLSNMIGLYFFGSSIGRYLGPEFLLKLYLAGALGGSIFYLVQHAFMSPISKGSGMWYEDPKKVEGLGASGAVNAILLLDIFLFPTKVIYLWLVIPVPAFLVGAFIIGTDLKRMTEKDSRVSGAGHLGGAAVAVLAWARIRRGRF